MEVIYALDLANPLASLKRRHPRLFIRDEHELDRVRRVIEHDPHAKHWYHSLFKQARSILNEPVARYHIPDGLRLLNESKRVSRRVMTLGLLHLIRPDQRYVDRIRTDVEAAAAFPDWNAKRHFLDTGEMALALAVAYDWLFHDWTEQQRTTILDALIRHAIRPGLDAYERGVWWTTTHINWNQVCNAGLIAAALCVADHDMDLAEQILQRCLAALPRSMKRYVPDGGYEEGPCYWEYGTTFNVYALAMLESALGHDFGLGDIPGFDRTGAFPIQMTGPTGKLFNFSDAEEKPVYTPAMFYLARRYQRPTFAHYAIRRNTAHPLNLLWYDPQLLEQHDAPLPLAQLYENDGIVSMRSAFDDPDALYVAAKGGRIDVGHGQMDLGSFVLDAEGVRWVIDLGRDDYNLPGYFVAHPDGPRWTYYRNRAEGHNTLVIDPDGGLDQHLDAPVPVSLNEGEFIATLELHQAYGRPVTRRLQLDCDHNLVRVIDTLHETGEPCRDVWWFAHTMAQVELIDQGRSALLTQQGKRMHVEIRQPQGARLQVMDARPLPISPDPPGQNPNNGAMIQNPADHGWTRHGELPVFGEPDPSRAVRKLAIHMTDIRSCQIEVVFQAVK